MARVSLLYSAVGHSLIGSGALGRSFDKKSMVDCRPHIQCRKKVNFKYTEKQLLESLSIEKGVFNKDRLTLFSIVKDEIYFLAPFLDHYRSIGVEQFIFLDDRSQDGTCEYIANQYDCVLLKSSATFGDPTIVNRVGIFPRIIRAGTAYKKLIPQAFLSKEYSLYADADEFLIIPPQVENLRKLKELATQRMSRCYAASLVEFFPANISTLYEPFAPSKANDLIQKFCFFEAKPLLKPRRLRQPKKIGNSKSQGLFAQFFPFENTMNSPT